MGAHKSFVKWDSVKNILGVLIDPAELRAPLWLGAFENKLVVPVISRVHGGLSRPDAYEYDTLPS